MPDPTSNFLEALDTRKFPAFSLNDTPNFPYSEYNKRNTLYIENERWASGEILRETVSVNNKEVQRFPVEINPVPGIILKHAYALFGESNQDDRPLVYPRVLTKDKTKKDLAHEAEEMLYRVWWESNGRSIQFENGIMSQTYGGCVFQLSWDPLDTLRTIPLRIDNPHPKYFIGRPSANDMWRLQEAWIVKPVTAQEAAQNGIDPNSIIDDVAWQVEHYTNSRYETTINGIPVRRYIGNDEWLALDTFNPWGFVPVVYIPHIRMGSSFYGINAFDPARGLIKELNRRVADFGDAVSVDSHAYVGMRNVQGAPKVQQIAPNLFAVNVGGATNITGDADKPDLFEIRRPSASAPMQTLIDELNDEIRRATNVPKVADGEDEGSQRSGLTLAMRMWPLVSHTNTERVFWTSGLDLVNRMILKMLSIKGEQGITIDHTTLRIKENWFPVLPRDREMTVNEAVSRMGANLGSLDHLLGMLGDVDDIDEEKKLIIEYIKQIAEITAKAAPVPGTPNPGAKPNRPAKNPQQKQSTTGTQTKQAQSSE
jgi:hypothetical protein